MRRRVGAVLRRAGRRTRRAARAVWRRKGWLALALVLAVTLPVAGFAAWAWHVASGLDLERVHEASFIYAAGQPLTPGLSIEATELAGTLRRLRYQEVTGTPRQAGQFRRTDETWDIFLHPRDDPRARRGAYRIRVAVAGGRISSVFDPGNGSQLNGIELEPEVVSGLSDTSGQIRRPARLSAVPAVLTQAVLAAEDHRFFDHGGVDARAVLRALWVNFRRGEVAQGGSTLTQQLVKNLLLSPRRTWDRKLREAGLATMLEWRYGKTQILEAYVNTIYMGQHGNAGSTAWAPRPAATSARTWIDWGSPRPPSSPA